MISRAHKFNSIRSFERGFAWQALDGSGCKMGLGAFLCIARSYFIFHAGANTPPGRAACDGKAEELGVVARAGNHKAER